MALLTEGVRFTPAAMTAAGLDPSVVMKQAFLAAMCFHAYQQVRVAARSSAEGHCLQSKTT